MLNNEQLEELNKLQAEAQKLYGDIHNRNRYGGIPKKRAILISRLADVNKRIRELESLDDRKE